MISEEIMRLEAVEKVYKIGDSTITALAKTSLSLESGKLTLIMGPSGSGKTTLLSILGFVIYPTSGRVIYQGKSVSAMGVNALADLRLREVGFVFQQFNLIEPLSALENVMQPLRLQKESLATARSKAMAALTALGLADRAHNLPKKLSGGQKQRVAIARALVTAPAMLLCDEPTAALDAKSATQVMNELQALAKGGKAVVVVSHDLRLRKFADRTIYVEEGIVSNTVSNEAFYK
ncbi:ABC transporter ATP-binding protein [Sphingobacterium oryzagri]|uniref:ABC transporter ATP-binding protein n=1 Tax=Sphingobacterium oryzagri TaxID=3025669 RepID=A0ABY7WDH0_9SPHI|nr:ABC transporter ATP-binding protein [Sphingobacterium sp. KACC 22765]WDF67547.1 ABC transporter ATP-binding protein [Sphingobacterium sp. KACC 22765]